MDASIVVNCSGRSKEAYFGLKTWLNQKTEGNYEIILQLFGVSRRDVLDSLDEKSSRLKIWEYSKPNFFNISAANNLGAKKARGALVLFANIDILYPPSFLESLLREIAFTRSRYAICNRYNMTEIETNEFYKIFKNNGTIDFAFLRTCGLKIGGHMFPSSPWVFERRLFAEIGGFNTNVYCYEDKEVSERAAHYLARTGGQLTVHSFPGFVGYHLHHPAGDVFDTAAYSKAQLELSLEHVRANEASVCDILQQEVTEEALLKKICEDIPPVNMMKASLRKNPLARRIYNAYCALRG